jgi:hypothetical protein
MQPSFEARKSAHLRMTDRWRLAPWISAVPLRATQHPANDRMILGAAHHFPLLSCLRSSPGCMNMIDYAANEGIEWVVLTNGALWRIYKVHFGKPIEKILVSELDAITTNVRNPEVIECFGNLSREGFSKGTMAELLLHKQVTNKFTVSAVLQTDFILEVLRREIRRMSSGVKVEVEYLRSLLRDEVLKRDLVDSDEAKAASQNIKRLQRAATRKKTTSREIEADEAPIIAKVEDAASSLPRAVAAQ